MTYQMIMNVWMAARYGHTDQLRQLLAGANQSEIEQEDGGGRTPLTRASTYGHSDCVELLLKAGVQVNRKDGHGWTAMHFACTNNRDSVVSVLLAHGADVNVTDRYGWTPLMTAASWGHTAVVKILLDAGAKRSLKNQEGRTALGEAVFGNKPETAAMIKEHEHIELVVRPEIVKASGEVLPFELAELCGDFAALTPVRREIERRQKQQN